MKFLPFETLTLETKLTEKEVIDRFAGFIEPENIFRLKLLTPDEPKMPYEGTINNHRFKILRITDNLRTTTPVVIGNMENNFNKTIIYIQIRPRASQIAGLCVLCIFVIYKLVINFSIHSFDIITLFFIGLIVFAYFHMMSMFKRESLKAKIDLMKLLEAREV